MHLGRYAAIVAIAVANISIARAEEPVTPREAADAVLWSMPEHPRLAPSAARASTPALTHVVFGYYPDYMGSDFSTVRFDLLTHVAYFTGGCTAAGGYSAGAWPFDGLVQAAHAQGAKAILVIPCFGDAKISAVLSNKAAFIEAVVAAISAGEKPDGLDLDFESMGAEHLGDFPTFVADLIAAVRAVVPGAEFSAALPAVDWDQSYDYPRLAATLDHLIIMGYDYHYRGGNPGPVSPLSYSGAWSNYSYDLEWSVNDYKTAIDDPAKDSKLVLGLPYYGYDWPSADFVIPGTSTASASSRIYWRAMDLAGGGATLDPGSQSKYYFYDDAGTPRQLWFDDAGTLMTKYEFAKAGGLGGIAIWALKYDAARPELWDAIRTEFAISPTPAPSPTPVLVAGFTPVSMPVESAERSEKRGCDAGSTSGVPAGLEGALALAALALLARRKNRTQ